MIFGKIMQWINEIEGETYRKIQRIRGISGRTKVI